MASITDTGLAGLRVFVVEDESLVAMQLEDMLFDFGCEVVGLAMRLNRAFDIVREVAPVDIAILDVNVNGEKVFPLAEHLAGLNIPVVFATGYGRSGVTGRWDASPVLQKPYTSDQLSRAMLQALPGGSSTSAAPDSRGPAEFNL